MKYPVFRFSALKKRFPALSSTRQFITAPEYLGDVKLEIVSAQNDLVRQPAGNEEEIDRIDRERPPVKTLYCAVFEVLGKIARSLSGEQENYEGTREFRPHRICEIFKDQDGPLHGSPRRGRRRLPKGRFRAKEYRIDLSREDWFAYTDHFGTSEEKALVACLRGYVGELQKRYDKVYLVRNERAFHLYSFETGERFEPDFVLLLWKKKENGYEQVQIFIEPKGSQLVEQDGWKEEFLLQMKEKAVR